ncbi:hypothetical protein G4B88_015405 [Cannabis sativa]|uniref:Uncharacterized protein n=1 Tax=Cannabis sativa TaxID=3483 RepID=A0A7J6DX76_CANSA|nr:hypothetical protein G4B88_015405 [Cannabis sativa]
MFGRQNEEEEEDCDDDEDEKESNNGVYATTRSRSSASTVTSIAYNEQGSIVIENWEDEEALRWAALERLPTYKRVRRGIFKDVVGDTKEVDVSELESSEQKLLLERLVNAVEDDPDRFFDRMRRRFDAKWWLCKEFPKVEVRYQNLKVDRIICPRGKQSPSNHSQLRIKY